MEHLDIHIDKYQPLSGSSYISLPTKLLAKKTIINMKNTKDNECFKWCVTAATYPRIKEGPRTNNKRIEEKLRKV